MKKTIKKTNNSSGMSYLEVVLSLAILSIFMVPALAMIVHINNLNDMAYKKSLSYNLGASLITIIAANLYEIEDFSQISSYDIFSLTNLSPDEFGNRFRDDIFTISSKITIEKVDFYITDTAPLGFTTNFLEIQPTSDEISIVEIYIELYIKDKEENLINQLSRKMPLIRPLVK